jgi:ATP-dependent Clp protease ATP-binding subunit ClpC
VDKFTKKAESALKNARVQAKRLGQEYIGTEHLLLGLLHDDKSVAAQLLQKYGVDGENVQKLMEEFAGADAKTLTTSPTLEYTPRMKELLEEAGKLAGMAGLAEVGTELLLLAILRKNSCMANKLLQATGADMRKLYTEIVEMIDRPEFAQALGKTASKGRNRSMLDRYTRDLTKAAREGRLDPVVGRDQEINRVIQILSRRTKNNPCLIGEPGVGKTAIAEALAMRIAQEHVPETMRGKRLLMADITGMVAGSKYRGEFEERIKGVIDEVISDGDVLLFIDEVHMLIGAGDAEGAMDAANILKPALARGELQILGATTVNEYRKHIEKDAALERRFQPVMVEEPNIRDCVEILQGLRSAYEKHHGVVITDEALQAAVTLSARYINDRFLPDKAIDLMDEAASKIRLKASDGGTDQGAKVELALLDREKENAVLHGDFEKASQISGKQQQLIRKNNRQEHRTKQAAEVQQVTAEDIANVVAEWTKIPVQTLTEAETKRLRMLEQTLHERVVGQEDAVSAVAKAVRRGRIGLKNPKRPIGSFLFLGPTGVGKTEISKALSEAVFGTEKSMIRVDMSEYMEKASVSKMIGSAPGYVGYEEGGQLAEKVRKNPYSVILFDEIEKAHPDVFNILLQILDDGQVTDSQGRHIDFKNTIIIMTSNCGASNIVSPKHLGFGQEQNEAEKHERMKNRVMDEVRRTFKPEFLNRIDEIIVFHSLEREQILEITRLMLEQLKKTVAQQLSVQVEFSQEVIEFLAEKGYDVKYGARPIRRAIQTHVEDLLADAVLEERVKSGMEICIEKKENGLVIETAK